MRGWGEQAGLANVSMQFGLCPAAPHQKEVPLAVRPSGVYRQRAARRSRSAAAGASSIGRAAAMSRVVLVVVVVVAVRVHVRPGGVVPYGFRGQGRECRTGPAAGLHNAVTGRVGDVAHLGLPYGGGSLVRHANAKLCVSVTGACLMQHSACSRHSTQPWATEGDALIQCALRPVF